MGEQFIGPYRLLVVLGHGPTTTVYKAWQESVGRAVTLKVVSTPDASALCRLQAESQLAASLSDPNIRQVYEAGQAPDGQVYVALQFVDGSLKDLMRQRLAARRPFTRDEIADLLAPIAGALDNLHRHKMVHLDIKPENILVFKDTNRAVLADLGIAQPQGTRTRAGTPLYASPEQAAGDRPIGPWCDVYSLGVVVYEMLAGRTPFRGSMDMALLRLHLEEKPPRLGQFRRDIPADLEQAVMQALSKDPRQRFPSATAFIEALRRRPTPIADAVRHTTALLRRTPQLVRRRPWVLGMIGLIIAVSAVALLVSRLMLARPVPTPTASPTPVMATDTAAPGGAIPATASAPTGAPVAPTATLIRVSPSPTFLPRTSLPTPVALTSTPIYPAPNLMSPSSGTTLRANQAETLTWAWGRQLAAGERFRVQITGPGGTTVSLTDGSFLSIGVPQGGRGIYQWTVDVVRLDSSGHVIQVLSGPSASWQITWQ
jgi:serine/threonine-protein kinase